MTSEVRIPGRSHALRDLLIVLAVLVIVKQGVMPHSIVFAGPASTFTAMAVATLLLMRRGASWADLGLKWPESWVKTAALTLLTFILIVATAAGVGALANLFFEDVGDSGRFDFVKGSLPAYLLIMALVWTHGSFFEELLFRAWTITHGSAAMGGSRMADYGAAVFSAVFFGYRHYYYQGINGAIVTGAIGLVLGILYVQFGRKNILPLAFAHGAINSLAQTSRFLSG